jgi:hypothetical protein
VDFNVNFNVLLSKYIVHPLVKMKKTLIKVNLFVSTILTLMGDWRFSSTVFIARY